MTKYHTTCDPRVFDGIFQPCPVAVAPNKEACMVRSFCEDYEGKLKYTFSNPMTIDEIREMFLQPDHKIPFGYKKCLGIYLIDKLHVVMFDEPIVYEDIITINDGDIFEGNIKQFEDCFFVNADIESITKFCEGTGMRLKITKAPVV